MESLISYRDPLFGIIVLATIVVIVSIVNFYLYKIKRYTEDSKVNKIVSDFHQVSTQDTYLNLLDNKAISIDILVQLMEYSYKIGDFTKTIDIGTSLIKYVEESLIKQKAINTIAKSYYKMGFLTRSINLFKESLSIHQQDITTLKYLLYLYDKIGDTKSAIDILTPLEELGVQTSQYKIYFNTKNTINNNSLSIEQKTKEVMHTLEKHPYTYRMAIEFLIQHNIDLVSSILSKKFNTKSILDKIYYIQEDIPSLENIEIQEDIKGILILNNQIKPQLIQTSIYQIDILLHYMQTNKKHNLELSFEYTCASCKQIQTNYTTICPNCLSIFSIQCQTILQKQSSKYENNQSLQ